MRQSAPYPRYRHPAALDGRKPEAQLYRRTLRSLTRHVGGKPTATQKVLIEQVAWLTVHLAHLNQKAMAAGSMPEWDARCFLAWQNTVRRHLHELGLEGTESPANAAHAALAARYPRSGGQVAA